MTQTTVNRQLSLLVKGIFEAYKVDNFQLEVDLVSALQRMISEGGKDPARMVVIREEILSSLLEGGRVEEEKIQMEGRIKAALGITTNGSHDFEEVIKFLVKKDKAGQPLEKYARWCRENPYDAPKPFQIAKTPSLLMKTWEMAFQTTPERVIQPTGTGFYA